MSQSLINSEAIKTLFEQIDICLPKYVPAMPSIILGLSVTLVIIFTGTIISMIDKNRSKKKSDAIQKYRWIIVLIIFAYLGLQVGDLVKDKHYTISSVRLNKQHFANIHWLRLYVDAFKHDFKNMISAK